MSIVSFHRATVAPNPQIQKGDGPLELLTFAGDAAMMRRNWIVQQIPSTGTLHHG